MKGITETMKINDAVNIGFKACRKIIHFRNDYYMCMMVVEIIADDRPMLTCQLVRELKYCLDSRLQT